MALPNFILTGTLKDVLGSVVGAELLETAMSTAVVRLVSNHPRTHALVWDGVVHRLEQPVLAAVDPAGELVSTDGEPLRLLARHDDLVDDLEWWISITVPDSRFPPRPGCRLRPWNFQAGADGDIIFLADTISGYVEMIDGGFLSGESSVGVLDGGSLSAAADPDTADGGSL
jgi:hypothetical protein